MDQLNFTPQYGISLIIVIIVISIILKTSPQMNILLIILIGLLVGYLYLVISNYLFPGLVQTLMNVKEFSTYMVLNRFDTIGYFSIWPPILIVLVLFIILLINRKI